MPGSMVISCCARIALAWSLRDDAYNAALFWASFNWLLIPSISIKLVGCCIVGATNPGWLAWVCLSSILYPTIFFCLLLDAAAASISWVIDPVPVWTENCSAGVSLLIRSLVSLIAAIISGSLNISLRCSTFACTLVDDAVKDLSTSNGFSPVTCIFGISAIAIAACCPANAASLKLCPCAKADSIAVSLALISPLEKFSMLMPASVAYLVNKSKDSTSIPVLDDPLPTISCIWAADKVVKYRSPLFVGAPPAWNFWIPTLPPLFNPRALVAFSLIIKLPTGKLVGMLSLVPLPGPLNTLIPPLLNRPIPFLSAWFMRLSVP